MSMTFEALDLRSELIDTLTTYGITEPSPIQQEAIPAALAGHDVLAQSQTGTGKTLAYLLPILQRIDVSVKHPQAVIFAPTRELAVQIAAEVEKFGAPLGIRGQSLIGGAAIKRQIERLRLHPHIVIGTPGRLDELIRLRKLVMHQVKTMVIDEADQMFALGSVKELKHVLDQAQRDRQLLFFSATLPANVRQLGEQWMRNPLQIDIDPSRRTAAGIEHVVFVCEERERIDTLRKLIRLYEPRSALVFVNELNTIAEATSKLQYSGLSAEALYSDAPKQDRSTILQRYRSGKLQTLVATDVAARGLDFDTLAHVFHLEPALDAEHYVHRAGRTGRMGRSGLSISIVTEKELFIMRKFEKQLGISIVRKDMYKGTVVDGGGRTRPVAADPSTGSRTEAEQTAVTTSSLKKPKQRASQSAAADTVKPAQAGKKPASAPSAAETKRAKRAKEAQNRERDRKNKGAPRWLKEKRQQNQQPGNKS